MADTKQPEALTLAAELRAGNWAPNILQNEAALRDRAADEMERLHAENESLRASYDTLRAGYDAARLEIESLQGRVNECGAGAGCCAQAARIDELQAQLESVGNGALTNEGTMPAAQAQPVAWKMDNDTFRFLSDVLTAAGLVEHGKQCKALAARLSSGVMAVRETFQAHWAPDPNQKIVKVDCGDYYQWQAAPAPAPAQAQPVASDINDIVVGAIFDFMGYLTTRDELLKLSAFHEAGPAVAAIEEWAEKAGLSLENARVRDWKKTSQSAAQAQAALVIAEAALADIGDADREPGDDVAWCEARAAQALPRVRAAIAAQQGDKP